MNQTAFDDLVNGFGDLLKRFEASVNSFATALDEHVKALERNPMLESLDNLLMEHERKLKEFGASFRPALDRLDQELSTTLQKCHEMLANVEGRKHGLSEAITTITAELQRSTQMSLVDRSGTVDDVGDATNSLARVVSEWFNSAKSCHDLLYTRLEKHENLLASEEKLVASFAILLKMREELVHARLEKREGFLKSKEELLRSFEELIRNFQLLVKGVTASTAAS